ncbi:MAG: hypothetical protein ACI86L_000288 [Dokdonia sp.]|jgi:uncharacterized protein (DUF1015 family)
MPKITPFCAVRPTRDKVGLVASRAYEHYTEEGRNFRMDRNPFSFLHIVNPGYKYHQEINGKDRFALVRNRYQEFKEDGIFIQDETPQLYVYKIVDRDQNAFVGIMAAAAVEDYQNNVIKKHEKTIQHREELFKEYLDTVGFNAEAVLLTYPDNAVIHEILEETMNARAEYEFTTTFRDTQYMWPLSDPDNIRRIQEAFSEMDSLYIADGHHRSASSALLAESRKAANPAHIGTESYQHFLSYLIPESHLQIYEFNRLVKDLNGLTKETFLIALDTKYRIECRGVSIYKPSKKHHFTMYLDGEFYSLYLRKKQRNFSNPLDSLDTQILHQTILKPILGIKDVRNDKRLAYADGRKDMTHVKEVIDQGTFAVGFGMLPITTAELKEIADAGLTMPPKSTYIEPKLRSGITIYEF